MKNLRKTLAAVIAMAVMSASVSAFAATTAAITTEDAPVSASYTNNAVVVTAANAGIQANSEMTFVIFSDDETGINDKLAGAGIDGDDIAYIDQTTYAAGTVFTGAWNDTRLGAMVTDTAYLVKVGYYDANGDFRIAKGHVTKAADSGVTGINVGTSSITEEYQNSITLTGRATAVGTAPFDDTVTYTIDLLNTTAPGADITNGVLTATGAGTVVVIATATGATAGGIASPTATITVTFTEHVPVLDNVTINGSAAAPNNADVELTTTLAEQGVTGVEYAWTITSGSDKADIYGSTTGATVTIRPKTGANGNVVVHVVATKGNVERTADHTIKFGPPTITFRWGDVTLDGVIDADDALATIYFIADKIQSYPVNATADFAKEQFTVGTSVGSVFRWGDVTLDGVIDADDALATIYFIADKIQSYPVNATADFEKEQFTVGTSATVEIE